MKQLNIKAWLLFGIYLFQVLFLGLSAQNIEIPNEPRELTPAVNIFFMVNSSEIASKEEKKLKGLIKKLKSIGEYRLILTGHTDSTGNDDYNLELSKDRVDNVFEILVDLELNPDFILPPRYFGRSKPRVNETSEEKASRNRRVEISIIEKPKPKPTPKSAEPTGPSCDEDTTIKLPSGLLLTMKKCDAAFLGAKSRKKDFGVSVKMLSTPIDIIKSGVPLVYKKDQGMSWLGVAEIDFTIDTCLERPIKITYDPNNYEAYKKSRVKVLALNSKTNSAGRSRSGGKTVIRRIKNRESVTFEINTKCPSNLDPEGPMLLADAEGKSHSTTLKDKTEQIEEAYLVQNNPVKIIKGLKEGNEFVFNYKALVDPYFIFKLSDDSYTEEISLEEMCGLDEKQRKQKTIDPKYKIKLEHLRY